MKLCETRVLLLLLWRDLPKFKGGGGKERVALFPCVWGNSVFGVRWRCLSLGCSLSTLAQVRDF